MARGKRNEPTTEPTEADCWYAAGFVDGEGCITVRMHPASRWNVSAYASVTVSQVDPRTLVWMQERWGGSLRPLKPRRPRERPAWEWCVVSQQAYRFLEGIRGMLKSKGEQADNALRLRSLRDGRGYPTAAGRNSLTEEDVAERQAIRAEALRLNQRGRL